MSNLEKNINNSAYEMTDDELFALSAFLFEKCTKDKDLSKMTSEERLSLIDFYDTLPMTTKAMDTMIRLGFDTKERLEEENRKLYKARGWEKYL